MTGGFRALCYPPSLAMRPVPLTLPALSLAGLLVGGCGALFGIGDLPPLVSTDGGGAGGGEASVDADGGTSGGDAARSRDGAPVDPGTDPRWPRWVMPPDDPPPENFSIENGANGAIVTDATTNLSWQDAVVPQTKTRTAALSYCDALVYDGKDDWRAPTRIEMVSIARFAPTGFSPHPPSFSGPTDACYWTASDNGTGVTTAGYWEVLDGVTLAGDSTACYVRCVRGGPPIGTHENHPYEIGTTTVLDPITGILWERTPPDSEFDTWDQADARCKSLTLDGRPARLPRIKELLSIVDDTLAAPASDPAFGTTFGQMWASTRQRTSQAWQVSFSNGEASWTEMTTHALSRCVAAP